MRLLISKHGVGRWAAHYLMRKLLQFKPSSTKPFILGLPTGSTPLSMYEELIKLNQAKKINFKDVITFNMDEYVGLTHELTQSFHHYMHSNFFDHIDIQQQNINILDGNAPDLEEECHNYEGRILQLGGMELICGGVGEDGHIAFNEPGSSLNSATRVKTLNHSTVIANSRFFNHNINQTPKLALTMGMKTILDAKDVVILASGTQKSQAVYQAIEGAVSSMCPISALQMHNKAVVVCDEFAAYDLKLKTIRYFEAIDDEYHEIEHSLAKTL